MPWFHLCTLLDKVKDREHRAWYHLRLRCEVVVEVTAGEFRAEDAGKLNFDLSAVDSVLRQPPASLPRARRAVAGDTVETKHT